MHTKNPIIQRGGIIMLKKEMTREAMLDALEQDYHGLMNLGDIYGARGVETAIDTIHLYEQALRLACEEIFNEYIEYAKSTDYGEDSEH